MKDQNKSKAQLLRELEYLRRRNRELESAENKRNRAVMKSELKDDRLNSIFRAAPIGIGVVSNRIIQHVNTRFCHMLGYKEEELIGKNARMVYPSQKEYDWVGKEKYGRIKKYGTGTVETRFKRKDKKIIDVILSSTPLHLNDPGAGVTFTALDITERKLAEKKGRRSKEQFRDLANSITDIFFAFDKDLRYTYWNKASEKLTGISEKDAIGKSIYNIFPDIKGSKIEKLYLQVLKNKQPSSIIYQYPDKNQKIIFELSVYPTKEGLSVFAKDITIRQEAEEKIRKERDKAQSYLDIAGVIIVSIDTKGEVTLINKKGCEILGYKENEVVGKNWIKNFLPERVKKSTELVLERLITTKKGDSEYYEYPVLIKNGKECIVRWHNSILHDDEGKIIGYLSSGEDITERKLAFNALQESERMLSTLMQNLPGMAYRCKNDKDWTMQFVSEGCYSLTGYLSSDLIGNRRKSYAGIILKDDRDSIWNQVQHALKEKSHFELEYRIITRDNQLKWVWERGIGIFINENRLIALEGFITDITKRKKEENALYTSEAQLSNAMKIARLGYWEYDVAGDLFTFNDHFYSIFHTTVKKAGGYTMSPAQYAERFLHPDDRDVIASETKQALETTDPHFSRQLEHRIIYADGTTGYISVRFFIVKDAQGKTIKIYGANQDITEQKRSDEALRESEELFRTFIEQAPDAIFVNNFESRILIANKMANKLTGYTNEELLAMHVWDIDHDIIKKDHKRRYWEKLQIGENIKIEGTHWRKDGTTYPAEIHLVKIIFKTKPMILAFIRDVTERKKVEEALRESMEKYQLLVENQSDLVIKIDKKGCFQFVNPSYCTMFGKTEIELLGKKFLSLVHKDDRANTSLEMANLYLPPYTCNIEHRAKTNYGWRWIAWADKAVLDDDNRVIAIVGVGRDISQHKQEEEEKQKLEEQLLHAQKLKAIGILTGGIAHDFNNLLTAILGNTGLLIDGLKKEDPMLNELEEIDKAANRAIALTQQLLTFSRKQPLQKRTIDINTIINNVRTMFERLIGEDIRVITNLAESLHPISADPSQIEQVIINLVLNARDAMPNGGKLTLNTENITIDETGSKKDAYLYPGKFVRLKIQDSGAGMDKKTIAQIFDPFFSTKSPGSGTGLGLSVVYGIVRQHSGWIHAESKPGRGSAFFVYFPVTISEFPDKSIEPVVANHLGGHNERILLVEDDEMVNLLVTRLLSNNGYLVFRSKSVAEALDIFTEENGDFQLIFSDIVLPDQSGIELVEKILKMKPEIKILLCSGYTDQKSQRSVICERGYKFLQKPYVATTLFQAIKDVLGQDK